MTDTNTALAQRPLSDRQLRTRLELAQRSFGLQQANQTQLNVLYLLCQKWDLDPLTDITLFEGRPWVTIDGRLRMLRRHPEYRGYQCRPLSKDEKATWGYEAEDIVVECTIRTTTWGEISARGKVSGVEVVQARARAQDSGKRAAPIGVHPVEVAEKRAVARAERAAFGQDMVFDEDDAAEVARTVVQERADPERIARNSETYSRIYESEYGEEGTTSAVAEPSAAVDPPVAEAPNSAGAALADMEITPLQLNSQMVLDANSLGIKGIGHLRATEQWPEDKVMEANAMLEANIREHQRRS
jgi:hypothetical protein